LLQCQINQAQSRGSKKRKNIADERCARTEFRKNLNVSKKDFAAVEYLLRKGHRQLEMYSSPGIRNIAQ